MLSYRVGIIGIGNLHSVTMRWKEGMLFGGRHLFDTLRFLTVAVEELVRALETGQPPSSDVSSARSDLELCVAFHVADQTGGVVTLPIADVDYAIADPWGRYS